MNFTPESHYCCECMAFFVPFCFCCITFLKKKHTLKQHSPYLKRYNCLQRALPYNAVLRGYSPTAQPCVFLLLHMLSVKVKSGG